MAFDAATQAKIDQLNSQKDQIDNQISQISDSVERIQPQIERANNIEQLSSLQQQLEALNQQYNTLQDQRDALESQINQIASKANNQTSPPTTTEKNSASNNTTAAVLQNEPQASNSLLSADEEAKQTESQYPLDSDATTSQPVIKTSSPDDAVTNKISDQPQSIDQREIAAPIDNPLHAYPNYTYGLSLHTMTPDEYNELANKGPKNFSPNRKRTLISSASRYHQTRIDSFQDDFYFENFKMETIIGLTQQAQGTNAIKLDFTIIEPTGLTLLNRLIDINLTELGATSYVEIPYLIEINFFGYDDDGKVVILSDHTKFIPVKLIDLKIKASIKGGVYEVSAVPFNHTAYLESSTASPANFQVTAKSLTEFFSDESINEYSYDLERLGDTAHETPKDGVDAATQGNNDVRTFKPTRGNQVPGARTAVGRTGGGFIPTPKRRSPASIKITSYVAAYNAWQQQAKKNGAQATADVIKVAFSPEIQALDTIVYSKKNPSDKAPAKSSADAQARAKNETGDRTNKPPAVGPDFERQIFNINAGTSLTALITQTVMNSEYILKQITDPSTVDMSKATDAAKFSVVVKKGTVQWFKIIPKVILGEYDNIRHEYQKTITYHVVTFSYENSKDPRLLWSFPKGYAKKYDYMYTGKNNDIIDFDIDFNTLYFTAAQSDLSKGEQVSKQQISDADNSNNSTMVVLPGTGVMPNKVKSISDAAGTGILNASTDSQKKQSQLISQSLLSTPRGDMLNLKLKIIGDPQFIKQDDILENPSQLDYDSTKTLSAVSNSLVMDAGEIYCYVTFKTPVDIDENTGLLRQEGKYVESVFSGYYRVLRVESEFSGGRFLQLLDLVRQFNQPQDNRDLNTNSQQPSLANPIENRESDKKLQEGEKANNPKLVVKSSNTTSSEKIKTNNENTSFTRTTKSTVIVGQVSGGGATITRADGSVEFLPDDPNERRNDLNQTIAEVNANDQDLNDIVNSGPAREGQDF